MGCNAPGSFVVVDLPQEALQIFDTVNVFPIAVVEQIEGISQFFRRDSERM